MARNLAVIGLEASTYDTSYADVAAPGGLGREIVDVLDGHGDPSHQTHEENLNVPNGYASIAERLRRFRQTTIGRLTMMVALSAPAITAGCGESSEPGYPGDQLPSAGANANPTDGSDTLLDGDILIIKHAECAVVNQATLDTYAAMTASEQQDCQKEIADLSAKDIQKLSPLSQARWMEYYRKHTLLVPAPMYDIDLKTYESTFQQKDSIEGTATVLLLLKGNSVAAMAWYMQQSDFNKDDPRTQWALFGPSTTHESADYKDAATIAADYPAQGITLESYINGVPSNMGTQLYDQGSATNIQATPNKEGGWDYSFTAQKSEGGQLRTFRYRILPYLSNDSSQLAKNKIYEVHNKDGEFLGEGMLMLPLANA